MITIIKIKMANMVPTLTTTKEKMTEVMMMIFITIITQ